MNVVKGQEYLHCSQLPVEIGTASRNDDNNINCVLTKTLNIKIQYVYSETPILVQILTSHPCNMWLTYQHITQQAAELRDFSHSFTAVTHLFHTQPW